MLYCMNCGQHVLEDEKYCIKCGNEIKSTTNEETNASNKVEKRNLQSELMDVFLSNNIGNFFLKYGIIFALYYPIYLLIGRVDGLYDVEIMLDHVAVLAFYFYYISLVALYAKKAYAPMLLALIIRFVNSIFLIIESGDKIPSITRIGVLIVAIVFLYKKFSSNDKCQTLTTYLSSNIVTCTKCGTVVKNKDAFCHKCGNKIGG